MRPDLSIIMVTHNGRERALETLESAHDALGDVTAEWFVVDCGSSDDTPDVLAARWPRIRVIRSTNIGFAAGNNVALAAASGRYFLLLNPDVTLTEGTLAELVQALDDRPTVGAASVVQRSPSGELLPSIRRFPSAGRQFAEAVIPGRYRRLQRLDERDLQPLSYETERSADWLVGAFLVVRSSAVAEVGLLDERFFLYSEETDWCYRFRAAGWDVKHIPLLSVVHHQGGYLRPELAAQLAYSKVLFAEKHYSRRTAMAIRGALALRSLLRLPIASVAGVVRHDSRHRAIGELRALGTLVGLVRPLSTP